MTTETKLIDLNREYTIEEFAELPDDDNYYELSEGKLVMSPAPGDEHAKILDALYRFLVLFDPTSKLGVVRTNAGVNLGIIKRSGKPNILAPDLYFVVANRMLPTVKGYLNIPPDLAVEIWSPTEAKDPKKQAEARDKIRKYLRAGVHLAWAINPHNQEVEVYHQGQLDPIQILTLNDELDGEDVIPGFRIKVKALFE